MIYPWIAEAIMDWVWEDGPCKHKGNEIICDKCELSGEICKKLTELGMIITDKIKKEGE